MILDEYDLRTKFPKANFGIGVEANSDVVIGNYTNIDECTNILENVVIGNNVSIGKRVFIDANVKIGDEVIICDDAIISQGVIIENEAIIAKHSQIRLDAIIKQGYEGINLISGQYQAGCYCDFTTNEIIIYIDGMHQKIKSWDADFSNNHLYIECGIEIKNPVLREKFRVIYKTLKDYALENLNPKKGE